MKFLKYGLSILLVLLLSSPFVFAEEFVHTLGGKVVQTLNEEDLKQFISNEVILWTESASEELNAASPNLEVASSDFQFNIDTSVEQFLEKADVAWYAFWKRKQEVHQPLTVTLSDRLVEAFDQDPSIDSVQTTNELQVKASVLSDEPLQLVATDISTADMERFSFVNVQTGLPAAELQAVSDILNERVLQPQEVFSLVSALEQAASPVSEQTANFVASMMYVAVLQSEFEIIERHSQGIVPSYTTLGLEAMVNQKLRRDFQFKNTFDTPMTMQVSHIGGVFLLEFYTLSPDSTATYEVGSREEIEPKRIERLVADISYGSERKIEDGRSGWRVTTYRTITSSTGSFETQEVVARDYYPPAHTVYEVSSQQPPVEVTPPAEGGITNPTNPDGLPVNPDGTPQNPDGSPTTGSGSGTSGNPGDGTGDGSTSGGSGTGDASGEDNDSSGNGSDSGNGYDKGGNKID